ncbi:MAG: transcriptional repressor [Rhizobiales bacterium]|nr:transcriptional repressor [Hyphomicrobiales bacterium]
MSEHSESANAFRDGSSFRPYEILLKAGLRPTRQRLDLVGLIFGAPGRHLTAKELYQLAREAGMGVSLATVYNTLHQFSDAAIIKRIPVDRGVVYFDADVNAHHHFYVDGEDRIIDIDSNSISFLRFPELPDGCTVAGVEVVIHLRRRIRDNAASAAHDSVN